MSERTMVYERRRGNIRHMDINKTAWALCSYARVERMIKVCGKIIPKVLDTLNR